MNCEHCGKEREPLILMGNVVRHRACSCPAAQKELEPERIKEEQRKVEQERRERLERYDRAGIKQKYLCADAECNEQVDLVRNYKGLYIVGKIGRGKTYLAASIAKRLINIGKTVCFVSTVEVFSAIKETYSTKQTENDLFNKYCGCDVLVLDDLGKQAPTDWALSILFRIINERYEKEKPIIITTQFFTSELIKRLSTPQNEENAAAIVSRLQETCFCVHVEGEDRRQARYHQPEE